MGADRFSAHQEARLSEIPTLTIPVMLTQADGSEIHHSSIDFMPAFARMAAERPALLLSRLKDPDAMLVSDIASALPSDVLGKAYDRQVSFPGLHGALVALHDQIGLAGFQEAHRILTDAASLQRGLQEAQACLEQVSTGRWDPSAEGFGMLWSTVSFSNEGYINGGEDLPSEMMSAGHERFTALHPRPRAAFDSPEIAAWNQELKTWCRHEMPPFVFGTNEVVWGGVTPSLIKDYMEAHSLELRIPGTDGSPNTSSAGDDDDMEAFEPITAVDAILESEMDDLFEDAIDRVADTDELYSLVEAWAATGDDAALAAGLSAWNAKQDITTYYMDRTVIVPVYPDVTQEEVIAFCKKEVATLTRQMHATLMSFEVPEDKTASLEASASSRWR